MIVSKIGKTFKQQLWVTGSEGGAFHAINLSIPSLGIMGMRGGSTNNDWGLQEA